MLFCSLIIVMTVLKYVANPSAPPPIMTMQSSGLYGASSAWNTRLSTGMPIVAAIARPSTVSPPTKNICMTILCFSSLSFSFDPESQSSAYDLMIGLKMKFESSITMKAGMNIRLYIPWISSVRYASIAYFGALLIYIFRKRLRKSGKPSIISFVTASFLKLGANVSQYFLPQLIDVKNVTTNETMTLTISDISRSFVITRQTAIDSTSSTYLSAEHLVATSSLPFCCILPWITSV